MDDPEERLPLVGKCGDGDSGVCGPPERKVHIFTPSQLSLAVGRLLHRLQPYSSGLRDAFIVVMVNCLAVCLALVVANAVSGPDVLYAKVSARFGLLSPWPLVAANILLICSYALKAYVPLRMCLALACVCFAAFAATSSAGFLADIFAFNLAMALLNAYHAGVYVISRRHVEFPAEFEHCYAACFASYLSRDDFTTLVGCGLVRDEASGGVLHRIGDGLTSLCYLVRGSVCVTDVAGEVLNVHGSGCFIESPEWLHAGLRPPESARHRSCFAATSNIVLIKWPREAVARAIDSCPAIAPALHAALGIETARIWLRHCEAASRAAVAPPPAPSSTSAAPALSPVGRGGAQLSAGLRRILSAGGGVAGVGVGRGDDEEAKG